MKKFLLVFAVLSLAMISNAAPIQAWDPINKVNRNVLCFPDGTLMAATGNTTTGVADMGNSSAAYLLAQSPAGTPNDPFYSKVSKTAETKVSITITASASGTVDHQILAAPGAGLKYSVNWANWNFANGCTCSARTAVLTSLASNGSSIQGTFWPFDIPATANSTVGSMIGMNIQPSNYFLVGGVNEPLQWKVSGANAIAGPCIGVLNLGYSIISQ